MSNVTVVDTTVLLMQHVVCLSIFVFVLLQLKHVCDLPAAQRWGRFCLHGLQRGEQYGVNPHEISLSSLIVRIVRAKVPSLVNCFCFAVSLPMYSSCVLIPIFNLTQWLTYHLTMHTSIFYIIRTVVWRWLLIPHQNIYLHVLKPEVGMHDLKWGSSSQLWTSGLIPRLLRPGMKWRLGPMVHMVHQEHIKSASGHYCPWSTAMTTMTLLCIFGNWILVPKSMQNYQLGIA